MTKWWKNPKGDDILAIILLQVISYFVWYRPVYTPHVHALMRDSNMIEVSIIHTHSPSTYFLLYVLLCCSVSHYSPQLIFFCISKGEVSENSPEEKQKNCTKLYSAVNNMNFCFRTTTFYDRLEGPGIQEGPIVDMILYAKEKYWQNSFLLIFKQNPPNADWRFPPNQRPGPSGWVLDSVYVSSKTYKYIWDYPCDIMHTVL